MKLELKRSKQAYFYHVLWIVSTVFLAIRNSTDFGRWTLIVIAAVGVISFISTSIRRNYLEVRNDTLLINKYYFQTQSVTLDKIEKLDIQFGPFESSYITLKDQTKIKLPESQTDFKELKYFMGQFGIPVE